MDTNENKTRETAEAGSPDQEKAERIRHHDRIAEAYEGSMGERFMLRLRERVAWICDRAGSGEILDIGCSQGTCPLLLGRSGAEVTGIDIDPEAIRYAVSRLLEEPVEVQSRVRYLCADFLSVDLPEAHYDAVVLTEILEHLEDPQSFLDKAYSLLKDGGRMVVTVPFGINAHEDHKRTYYFAELYGQLSASMTVAEVEFFDGWLGYLAIKNARDAVRVDSDLQMIAREESAFFRMEQDLRESLQRHRQRNADLTGKVQSLSDKLRSKSEESRSAREQVQELKNQLQVLEKTESAAKAAEARWQSLLREKETEFAERSRAAETALREKDEELAARDRAAETALRKKDEELAARDGAAETALRKKEEELNARMGAAEARWQSLLRGKEDELRQSASSLEEAEAAIRERDQALRAREEELREAVKREAQFKERSGKFSGELKQAKQQLELSDRERADLRGKLQTVERDYHELLDTPSGNRAYLRLLKAKFRRKRRAAREERRIYQGGPLRRAAKRFPLLVRIVKKIRLRHPDSEFLVLEASRSDFQQSRPGAKPAAVKAAAPAGVKKPASQPVEKPKAPEPKAEPAKPAKKPAAKQQEPDSRVMTREQEKFVESLLPKLNALPESNGSRYYEQSGLRIGVLCDEFFLDSIRAAADFVPLTPENWREQLPTVDLLLVVTLWRGLQEEWRGVANVAHPDTEKINMIFEMIEETKRMGKPTVFFSKEDPPNYSVFIQFARKCDYIFTTAEECLPDYIRDTGNPRPRVLRFSINPLFHNPVGFRKFEKEKTVMFSGSWMEKYPDRCRDMSMLFDGVLSSDYGLHIIDRNYPSNRKYLFPHAYFPYVSPALDHATLQKVHKLFDWAINTNSVQFSRTMFANRAYELQATGVLLLSNYSLGVNRLLPNVFMAFSSEEVTAILSAYTPEEIYERQIAGVRSVMRSDTCFDRMDELYEMIGLDRQQKQRRIAVIGDPRDPATAESFARQTFPDRKLLAPEEVTADILKDFDMVAFFGGGMEYGEFYLEDMANGFKYTACDYITKAAYREGGELHPGTEHDYVGVMGSRFRTLFWREAFPGEALLELEDGMELPNGYSIDRFQYDAAPRKESGERSAPYRISVVVPVFNNGPHLYGKCFSSLRRSSLFPDMEILLVDDGSTDGVTPKYIRDLAGRYANIRPFFFETGGSGSAARPRKKGAELASAEYVAFLDPEDEASEDGFAKLLESLETGGYEAALGGYLEAGTSIRSLDLYGTALTALGSDALAGNGTETLRRMGFPEMRIQSAVLRKSLLTKEGAERIPELSAQELLPGWQLLRSAGSLRFLPVSAHVVYRREGRSPACPAACADFLGLPEFQRTIREWLVGEGELEAFRADRLLPFTKDVVLKNLAQLGPEAGEEALASVREFLELNAEDLRGRDEDLDRFCALCTQKSDGEAWTCLREMFALPEENEKADTAQS